MGFLDRVVEAIWETLDEFQGGPDRPSTKKNKKKKATEVGGGAGQTAAETVFESTDKARD